MQATLRRVVAHQPPFRTVGSGYGSCLPSMVQRSYVAQATGHNFRFPRSLGKSSSHSNFQAWRIGLAGIAGISALSIHAATKPVLECDAPPTRPDTRAPPPESIVNVYELTFGSVAGICAGLFIKKGLTAVAFFVGGVFVLLQYFTSMSLVRVDWARFSQKFENLFYTLEPNGQRRAPSVRSLWNWLVDFLTADFQPRATFLAGLMLGVRIG